MRHNLGWLAVARACSAAGTWMAPLALTFLLLDRHYQLVVVGLVLAARSIPSALLSLIGGLAADRFGARRVMIGADLLRFAAHGALFIGLVVGQVSIVEFVIAEFVVGLGSAFFSPSLTGLIPQIVEGEKIAKANALRGMIYSVAMIVAPIAAGFLISIWSPTVVIGIDALVYLGSAGALALLVVVKAPARIERSIGLDIKRGLGAIRERPWVWQTIVIYMVNGALVYSAIMLLGPAIAKADLHGPAAWGLILGGLGIGTALGSTWAMRLKSLRRPILMVIALGLLWVIPMASLALVLPLPVIVMAAVIGGVGWGLVNPVWFTTLQKQIPGDVLSQVASWDTMATEAASLIGYVLVGAMAGLLAPTVVIAICAAVWTVICILGLVVQNGQNTFANRALVL